MSIDLQSEKGRSCIRIELNEELRRLCEQFPPEESVKHEQQQQVDLSLGTELVGFGTQLIDSASIDSIASRKRVRRHCAGLRSLGSVVPGLPPPPHRLPRDQKQQLPDLTLEEANWFVSRLHVHKRDHFLAQAKLMDGALDYGCSCPSSEQPASLTAGSRGGEAEDEGYPQVMARMARELTRAFQRGELPILALRAQTAHLTNTSEADDPLILGLARLP